MTETLREAMRRLWGMQKTPEGMRLAKDILAKLNEDVRVVVVMDGGLLQTVMTNSCLNVTCTLVDYDVEGSEESSRTPVPQGPDQKPIDAVVEPTEVFKNVEEVNMIFDL